MAENLKIGDIVLFKTRDAIGTIIEKTRSKFYLVYFFGNYFWCHNFRTTTKENKVFYCHGFDLELKKEYDTNIKIMPGNKIYIPEFKKVATVTQAVNTIRNDGNLDQKLLITIDATSQKVACFKSEVVALIPPGEENVFHKHKKISERFPELF